MTGLWWFLEPTRLAAVTFGATAGAVVSMP